MRILCLVKFTPDVDAMEYDYENGILKRENIKQIINPEDACAMGFVLRLKKTHPELYVDVLTMAPLSVMPLAEDIARRAVDRVTLLSDRAFAGSDTLATSRILGKYLQSADYDVILTGGHTLDGDTAHVPAQLAEILNLPHLSGIRSIDPDTFLTGHPLVEVDTEYHRETYEVELPAVLSVSRDSKYKLPFVRFADLDKDVSDRIQVLDRETLGLSQEMTGLQGSATRVVHTFQRKLPEKQGQIAVSCDDEGVETVFQFLKQQGYLS